MAENNRESITGKKTVFLLLGIIGFLLLVIAGGAVFFLPHHSLPVFSGESGQVGETQGMPAHSVKDYYYYEIKQPLRVSFPQGGSVGLIEIRVAFLGDADMEDVLAKHEPMIVNNLLMTISAAGADQLMSKEGKVALRRQMLQETEKVLQNMTGRHHVKEVFFTTFVMQ